MVHAADGGPPAAPVTAALRPPPPPYLGFDVGEQQHGAADLQQHVLTPQAARLLQELQPLHAVAQGPELHRVQLACKQVLRPNGDAAR